MHIRTNKFWTEPISAPSRTAAFEKFIKSCAVKRLGLDIAQAIRARGFKSVLRSADKPDHIDFLWKKMELLTEKDPVMCLFHHGGWIFFGRFAK